jgi:hypothetical protein
MNVERALQQIGGMSKVAVWMLPAPAQVAHAFPICLDKQHDPSGESKQTARHADRQTQVAHLRASVASEGCVGGDVCDTEVSLCPHLRYHVHVVSVHEGAVQHTVAAEHGKGPAREMVSCLQ